MTKRFTTLTSAMALCLTLSLAAVAAPPEHSDHPHDGHKHGEDHQHKEHHGDDVSGMHEDLPEDFTKAIKAGGTLVEVNVLGMVCDFCATALTKTFKKREEVAVVTVDLDNKVLRFVTAPGKMLDDATITDLVTKAGYKTASIRRGGEPAKEAGVDG